MSDHESRPAPDAGPELAPPPWKGTALLAGLAVLFGLTQVMRWPEPLGLDQSLFACFGRWLPEGAVPYRDLWDSKPPGIFYLYALAFQVCGAHAATIRAMDGLATAAGALAVYLLGRRLGGTTGSWAAAAYLLFAHLPYLDGVWSSAQAETFIGPIVAAALLLAARPQAGPPALVAAGALVGSAAVLKIPCIVLGLPILLYLGLGKRWRACAWFLGGLPAVPVLALILLWSHGVLALFHEAVFTYSRLYWRIASPPNYIPVAAGFLAEFAWRAPLYWGLIGGGAVCTALGLRCRTCLSWWAVPASDRRLAAATLAWWGAAVAVVWGQALFAKYHFVLLLAPSSLLVGAALRQLARRGAPSRVSRWVWGALLVGVLLGAWRGAEAYLGFYAPNIRFLTGRLDESSFLRRPWRGASAPARDREIGRFIAEQSEPEETILIWGLAPVIYMHADRRPATRYPFHHVLLTDAPISLWLPGLEERRRQFMEGLAAQKPAFILVGLRDPNIMEPRDSQRQLRRFPAFHQFVRQHYVPDHSRRGLQIYRRR